MIFFTTKISIGDWIAITSAGIALCALAISIIVSVFQSISKKREIILEHFEEMYNDCFNLRVSISEKLKTDWYYEVDALATNESAFEEALNHVNKLCNLFTAFIYKKDSKKLWLKLMPIKLFNRLIAMYPFILYCRTLNKDNSKFNAFEDMLICCIKSKAIKERYFEKDKIVWVGTRASDSKFSNDSVFDNISIFGHKTSEIRPNHNIKDFNGLLSNEIEKKIKKNPKTQFMIYNPSLSYLVDKKLRKNILCVNNESTLLMLNDKIKTRAKFSGLNINCLPSVTINSDNLDFATLCTQLNSHRLVVQHAHGGGGYATYVVHESNYQSLCEKLRSTFTQYLVSPYLEKSISVNLHVIVCEKQNVIFPASIQIIENINDRLLYRGADFISFREIDSDMKNQVRQMGSAIANELRRMGYKGIAGIDLIIADGQLFFVELNPRFQASSYIIDKYLSDKFQARKKQKFNGLDILAKNLVDLNLNAFNDVANIDISFFDEINYSCYFYFKDGFEKDAINYKLSLLEQSGISVDRDGYNETSALDEESYLFRALFNEKITQISPDGDLWICDNVKFNNLEQETIGLKIALLNQGVRLNINKDNTKLKEAVFDAVDFYIQNVGIHVNSPIKSKLVYLSPFEIVFNGQYPELLFNGTALSRVDIEYDKIENTNEFPERKSLYMSTDRLRINPAIGCQFKSQGLGCRFCNFIPYTTSYSIEQLKKAYDYGRTLNPRHVMIGGGSVLESDNLNIIKRLAEYIKSQDAKMEITLMSVPQNISELSDLKAHGITDVSFNIEIFNEKLARQYMPGKSRFSRQYYFDVLAQATRVWQGYGNVRSLIMVGLERTNDLFDGIKKLVDINVQPVLSVFRPMEHSPLGYMLSPTNSYLRSVYDSASSLLKPKTELGPKCTMCKNNTLAI